MLIVEKISRLVREKEGDGRKRKKLAVFYLRGINECVQPTLTPPPSRITSQQVGSVVKEIISFEHINIHGINSHYNLVVLTNILGVLE